MYENYAERYAQPLSTRDAATAIRFADYLLDHPEELAEAQKEAEEIEREWKEHQAKQPPQAP
jgi:hypothetical protein